jgi:hypothetical protein
MQKLTEEREPDRAAPGKMKRDGAVTNNSQNDAL